MGRGPRGRIGRHAAQAEEKIQRRGVQPGTRGAGAEVMGQETVAARALAEPFGLQFLVAVLARAAFGVVVVSGLRNHTRTRAIGDDEPQVGA